MPLILCCFALFPAAVIGRRIPSFQTLGVDRQNPQKTVAEMPEVIE